MIENAELEAILETANDISVVCEIYGADATPEDFEPANAIGRYAAVDGITLDGESYTRIIKKFGGITRNITKETNKASVEFSNVSREMSRFEFQHGFEGLIMVIRLLSREGSEDLENTMILFAGRCEKPTAGNKDSLNVTATWILGNLEVPVPRRKYAKEDQDGRVPSDPEFEGFLFMPEYGTTTYTRREKRGGILGWFGFKKTVKYTLPYSSFSDIDANKPVPEVLGRSQLMGTHIGYIDSGTIIKMRTAWSEGEIHDIQNVRSTDSRMYLSATNFFEAYGQSGAANAVGEPAAWVAPGNYSRTAFTTGQVDNSAVDEVEPAPDLVGVILGRLMTVPDEEGNWVVNDTWTDNGAAHVRFLLTSEDYFKLEADWLEAADFYQTYVFNSQLIIDRSLTDFLMINPA